MRIHFRGDYATHVRHKWVESRNRIKCDFLDESLCKTYLIHGEWYPISSDEPAQSRSGKKDIQNEVKSCEYGERLENERLGEIDLLCTASTGSTWETFENWKVLERGTFDSFIKLRESRAMRTDALQRNVRAFAVPNCRQPFYWEKEEIFNPPRMTPLVSLPCAVRLDHFQPVKLILFQNLSTFFPSAP